MTMSKLMFVRILQSLLTGILTGFAIIGGEAAFMHQLPEGPGDIAYRMSFGLAAAFFGYMIAPWLEARVARSAARAPTRLLQR
jgi:hypothetical protein